MDNLSHVIAVDVHPGYLQPCLRLNRGVYTASTVNSAPFTVDVTVTYTSGGQHQAVTSTQLISGTQFMQQLDAHSIRAKGQQIGLRTQPDPHSVIVVATRVLINDAAGTPVECWSADTNNFRAP